MTSFSISSGGSTTFTDTTPDGGLFIDFERLDNSLSVQVNGVDLFVGGLGSAPNELEFQTSGTQGQTVGFADDTFYGSGGIPQIWQLGRTNPLPDDVIFRLRIDPDGDVQLFGVKSNGGPLEELKLLGGLTVNSSAIAAAWNPTGPNTIVVNQTQTGPTNADGDFVDILCFASGTLIETKSGSVRVDDLKTGDLVLTYDHGHQPLRWVGACCLSAAQLAEQPKLRPVVIRAGALGDGYPAKDLIVSPQHRILVSSAVAARMFDTQDVLIPAIKLVALEGIDVLQDTAGGVAYFHVLFDAHQIIWSNGALSESLFTGPEALKAVSPGARKEIAALFPQCLDPSFAPASARYIPKSGKRVAKLVARHQANQKAMFAEKE
jgi:hypothetical protein